jgi:hypothetical protein
MPIPEKIKLPEPGLPKGLESEDDLSVTPPVPTAPKPPTASAPPVPKPGTATGPPPVPSKPAAPPVPKPGAAKIDLPKPGLPKPSDESKQDVPKLPDLPKAASDAPKLPTLPKPDIPPVPSEEKTPEQKKPEAKKPEAEEKSDKNLYETDTDIQPEEHADDKPDTPKDSAEEDEKSDLQRTPSRSLIPTGMGRLARMRSHPRNS